MIQVSLPYPISSNLYWRHCRGITFVSKRALEYRKAVKDACCEVQPMSGKVAIFVTLCAKKPKRETGKEPRVIDLDNCLKVLCDALQGCAFENDKQIHAISAKYGDPVPGGCLNVMIVKA